ncbi:MAG: hypothetical protein AAF442_03940 [Pseudomonadota bacterium]
MSWLFSQSDDGRGQPLHEKTSSDIVPARLHLGKSARKDGGGGRLEICTYRAQREPSKGRLHQLWKNRQDSRDMPVLVIVHWADESGGSDGSDESGSGARFSGQFSLCGFDGETPPVYHCDDLSLLERLCEQALCQLGHHAARRYLADALTCLDQTLSGLHNVGMLSEHCLAHARDDYIREHDIKSWQAAQAFGKKALTHAHEPEKLLSQLGYDGIEKIDHHTHLLTAEKHQIALAVFLKDDEIPELAQERFNNLSPVSYALGKGDQKNVPWIFILHEGHFRLYATENIGVGKRGRSQTYLQCNPDLLRADQVGLLWLLFSTQALRADGTFSSVLDNSGRFAGDLATRLRDRIYDRVVPQLAQAMVAARKVRHFNREALNLTYEMALTVLFRLLFVAYAEDRDLLPYKTNESYRQRSLKRKAIELAQNDAIEKGSFHHWNEITELWSAIAFGHREWGIPPYNGTLFSADKGISNVGAALVGIALDNEAFVPVLRDLLLIETDQDGLAPVDFRSLSVQEFGTIYEGLLESELSRAERDLRRDKKGSYVPADLPVDSSKAKKSTEKANNDTNNGSFHVAKGQVYLHDRSGARKASGSYYTPIFIVNDLLDKSLEPALTAHLERLERLEKHHHDASNITAAQFFDFRVADIAMGSGHFLIAAIDRIEQRMSRWLQAHPQPQVLQTLNELRAQASAQLEGIENKPNIEDSQLLRRMIARRCIYGVDVNPLAVQLAQLSVWIHTFVPGLPLSLLDRTLVCGNALIGIAHMDEAKEKIGEHLADLFGREAFARIDQTREPLRKLGELNDVNLHEIEQERALVEDIRRAVYPLRALCDVMVAQSIATDGKKPKKKDREKAAKDYEDFFRAWGSGGETSYLLADDAEKLLAPLQALHFPLTFPEVFLSNETGGEASDKNGFDVLIGNPPWEKPKMEEHGFWARYVPGLRGLSQRERESEKEALRKSRPDLVTLYEGEKDRYDRLRAFLVAGGFPGMGTGDPDLYKAFAWRFWRLVSSQGGRMGVVLPRSALAGKGSEDWRKTLFARGALEITTLLNRERWVFDIHPQFNIALVAARRFRSPNAAPSITLRGPFASREAFAQGRTAKATPLPVDEVLDWDDSATLPQLPPQDPETSLAVFRQLRAAPRLDLNTTTRTWRTRPHREMDSANDKGRMDLTSKTCPAGFWPVYKGESFELWQPDTGTYYAYADPDEVLPWLQDKRQGTRSTVHAEFGVNHRNDLATLAAHHPRIAFRDVTNRTNSRTMIVALIPGQVFCVHTTPYLLWPRGDERDQAFLLGVLSSRSLDWYARRFVELHMTFFILNALPIPRPSRDDPRWQRVVALAGRLASTDERFADWAQAVGAVCGPLEEAEKAALIHELDAVVAHLYGLKEDHLRYIFETFQKGWDYQADLKATLDYYHQSR